MATDYSRLDDLLWGEEVSLNTNTSAESIAESKRISANTTDKAYRKLVAHANVTSYSKLGVLHECPRKYELEELKANSPIEQQVSAVREVNLDFAYGHAVGAGIQTYAATRSLVAAQFAAFIAWKAPWDAEKLDKSGGSTGKSLAWALVAVEKFGTFFSRQLSDFEVVRLPNGHPATELSFAVDFSNGYYHFGHIDTLLRSKSTGRLAVWEGKTTGFETVDEAVYANSSQALSYSVVVDAIAKQIGAPDTDYEVLYVVYSSKSREFTLMPFGKSKSQRAEWLQDILLDHANISQYRKLSYFPKRGESCYNYGFRQQCSWFGQCTMKNSSLFPANEALPVLTNTADVENVDYKFTLDDLVAAQKEKV